MNDTAVNDTGEKLYRRLTWALWGSLILIAFFTRNQYGFAWDEAFHLNQGRLLWDFYSSGFSDPRVMDGPLKFYGNFYDLLAYLLEKISRASPLETRRLLGAATGLAGIAGAAALAGLAAGARARFFTVLLLGLTPIYYGHMFNNPVDLPFAAAYTWALYFLLRVAARRFRPGWRVVAGLGLAMGAAMGVRVGGVLLFGYLGLICLAWSWRAARRQGWGAGLKSLAGPALKVAAPAMLLAWGMMLLFWPWAWDSPFLRPLQAMGVFSGQSFVAITVLLGGKLVLAKDTPLYLPHYFGVQLPLPLLLLLAAAPFLLFRSKGREGGPSGDPTAMALLFLAAFFPLLVAVVLRSSFHDTIRHFLFVVPAMTALAALALDRVASWCRERAKPVRWGLAALALLLLGETAFSMVRLHPYQYLYYNPLAGSAAGAAGRYELDYWCHSYREAVAGLVARLQSRGEVPAKGGAYGVYAAGRIEAASSFFPKWLEVEQDPIQADFVISHTRRQANQKLPGRAIINVSRAGALLGQVKDARRGMDFLPALAARMRASSGLVYFCPEPRLRRGLHRAGLPRAMLADPWGAPRGLGPDGPGAAWLGWETAGKLSRGMHNLGLKCRVWSLGGARVFEACHPPAAFNEIPAQGWSAVAGHHPETTGAAWDRDYNTRWCSGAGQAVGMSFTLDLGRLVPGVCRVRFFAKSPHDLPLALRVETSRDGASWEAAGSGPSRGLRFIYDGYAPRAAGKGSPLELGFKPRAAHFVRFVQTGGYSRWDWSINDLALYRAQDAKAGKLRPALAAKWLRGAARGRARLAPPLVAERLGTSAPKVERGALGPTGGRLAALPWHADQIRRMLAAARSMFREQSVGGFAGFLVRGFKQGHGLERLAKRLWRVEAALNPGAAGRMHDGDLATRWSSGAPQKPGMSLTVTLAAPAEIAGLNLALGKSRHDYPRRLLVEIKKPGGRWLKVPHTWVRHPSLWFNGSHLLARGGARETVVFKPTPAVALRLTLLARAGPYYWSIHELEVLTPPGRAGEKPGL